MFFRPDAHTLLILGPIILLSLTLHEYAHGRMAEVRGDPTARMAGRITLNPLAHLDPIGTLMLFFARIGWARPVPYDPTFFRRPRQDTMLVALAGPAANIGLAFAFGAAFRLGLGSSGSGTLGQFLLLGVLINLGLAFFNLLPVPPLDGSKVAAAVLPPDLAHSYVRMEPYAPLVLMLLILPGFFSGFSPVWMVIGPFVDFFFLAFTGAGGV